MLFTGGLIFIILTWGAAKLNLFSIDNMFISYKGIITRQTNKKHTVSSYSQEPRGGEIEEHDEYDNEEVYRELYNKNEDMNEIIKRYKSLNESVTEHNFMFWQLAYIEGFKVDNDKLAKANTILFKVELPILFILDTLLKTFPLIIFVAIIELTLQLFSRGKKSLTIYIRSL